MEPCHSVTTPRSPAFTSAVTVAHLISNIEQLKNKDKLISQLEKDLGQQWVAAHLAALDQRTDSALPEGGMEPPTGVSWTPSADPTPGYGEMERSAGDEGFAQGKTDLRKKLKDCKERNKELLGKCRAYLQRSKELTAQNRAYKDSSDRTVQENKTLHEMLEHSKLRLLQLSRQLGEVKAERTNLERQTSTVDQMKKEMMEDKNLINGLRQACSEKDRRIELIQHRKKRRLVMGSAEKSMGVRETFYGYDEDNKSVDSEHSMTSSLSHSTVSDEDGWDEVMTREDTEHNYHRLMMEQLDLQKSHALLQSQVGNMQDPQREAVAHSQVQHDLFKAQCRIEQLEKLINEIGEGEVMTLLKEREDVVGKNRYLCEKVDYLESECTRLHKELSGAHERGEDLEFRLMEFEHRDEDDESSTCDTPSPRSSSPVASSLQSSSPSPSDQPLAEAEADPNTNSQTEGDQQCPSEDLTMEQLYKELSELLKGRGKEAESVLTKLDKVKDVQRKSDSLEFMAHELQVKVISLQKERDSLQDELSHKSGGKSKKGNVAAAASRERQENMELKAAIERLVENQTKHDEELSQSKEQNEDWKIQYIYLKQQLDILTQKQSLQTVANSVENTSSGDSTPPSPISSPAHLNRQPSKDRKSKSRSGDDSTPQSKRRKSSKDISDTKSSKDISDTNSSNMLRSFQSVGNIKSLNDQQQKGMTRAFKSNENFQSMVVDSQTDAQKTLSLKANLLEAELSEAKEENSLLIDQLKQSALEKSTEAEADQQMLLDKLHAMDNELSLLRRENVTLGEQLRQRVEEFNDSQGDIHPRVTELEDYCEDLQERLHAAGLSERQLKEKLKLVESSIEDAETNEMAAREDNETLLARETEAKNQILELQRTGRELKDIILDKDIVEMALRDKVEFLQKAEAASVQRIEELESIEHDLREQLEQQSHESGAGGQCQRENHKIQELKHQFTFLETDNRALSSRVAELEENEEILRENWRRVADEDFNRTQCLEQKVKILEQMNRQLKSKLSDAQEYYVINTVRSGDTSLAAELASSQSNLRSTSQLCTPDLTDQTGEKDDEASDGNPEELVKKNSEEKVWKDKLRKLERKLSDIAEQKNSEIESKQEKIDRLRENEIKLSETIAEMEMTERELRAKLALYESSEVTVEKMFKYQSKIEELRTSQESLLDQLENMETQEMTLQEQMEEMERTLRGKIVTLEVEMKNYKQKELKQAGKIRELEKQEKDLLEKLSQQAEKENGLFVKISSLMDDVKASKGQNDTLKTQLADREDKVRKSKLLEVKLLEIEMEFGKKSSTLSSKLRHKEEELRQKEAAHEQEKQILREELAQKGSEQTQRTAILEKMFGQKERELTGQVSLLEDSVKELTCERDEYEAQVKDLTDTNKILKEKNDDIEKELTGSKENSENLNILKLNFQTETTFLREDFDKQSQRADDAEETIKSLESDLLKERQTVLDIESKMVALKDNISEKMKIIESNVVEKENDHENEKRSLKTELKLKEERVEELEKELGEKCHRIYELESECEKLRQCSDSASDMLTEQKKLESIIVEKEKQISEVENNFEMSKQESENQLSKIKEAKDSNETELIEAKHVVEEKNRKIRKLKQKMTAKEKEFENNLLVMKSEQEMLENELRNKVLFLNTQLTQEVQTREAQQSNLEDSEKTLSSEVTELRSGQEQYKLELIQKLSELETKNKENCQLALELSSVKHSLKTLQNDNYLMKEREASVNTQFREIMTDFESVKFELAYNVSELEAEKEENSKQVSELNRVNDKLKAIMTEYNDAERNWCRTEESLNKQFTELNIRLEQTESKVNDLESELAQRQSILSEATVDKEQVLIKQSEIEKLMEEKLQQEVMVQEHLQKSEEMLQESKQQKENKEMEVQELRRHLEVKDSHVNKHWTEKATLESESEQLKNNVASLKEIISQLEANVEDKSEENSLLEEDILNHRNMCNIKEIDIERLQQELARLQDDSSEIIASLEAKILDLEEEMDTKRNELMVEKDDEIETLQRQLHEKIVLLQQTEFEHKDSHSQILTQMSHKHHELEHSEKELKKCLQDIEQYKNDYKHKQEELNDIDQTYKETLKEHCELTLQLRDRDQQYEHIESEMANVEVRLVEAENRYRELESKFSSLELQLEERFAQAQQSDQVLVHSDKECQELQVRLNSLQEQCSAGQDELVLKVEECKVMKIKLAAVEEDVQQLRSESSLLETKLEEVQIKAKDSELRNVDIQKDVEQLEKMYKDSTMDIRSTEDRLLESKTQHEQLERKLSEIEHKLNDRDTECLTLRSNVKKLEEKNTEAQTIVKETEETTHEAQQKSEEFERHFNTIEAELKQTSSHCEKLELELEKVTQKYIEKCCQCDEVQREANQNVENLQSQLTCSEHELQESHNKIEELNVNISIIVTSLHEKDTVFKVSQSGFDSLKKKQLETQIEFESVKLKLSCLQQLHDCQIVDLQEAENIIKRQESNAEQIEISVQEVQELLDKTRGKLSQTEQALKTESKEHEKRQESLVKSESNLKQITKDNSSLMDTLKKSEDRYKHLQLKLDDGKQLHSKKETICNELKSKLESSQHELRVETKERNNCLLEMDKLNEQLTDSESKHSQVLSELEEMRHALTMLESQHKAKCVELETWCETVQSDKHSRDGSEKEMVKKQLSLQSTVHELEEECSKLQDQMEKLESSLQSSESDCKNLNEKNLQLSQQLIQLGQIQKSQEVNNSLQEKLNLSSSELNKTVTTLESVKNKQKQPESENYALREELEDATREFENIQDGFDESKANIEERVISMSESKDQVIKDFNNLQEKYVKLSKHVHNLTKRLKEKDTVYETPAGTKSEVEEKTKISEKLTIEVDFLRGELGRSQQELLEKEEKEKVLNTSLCNCKEELSTLKAKVEILNSDNTDFNEKFSEVETLYNDAHFENAGLLDELSHVKAEITILETQLKSSQNQLAQEKQTSFDLEEKLQVICTENEKTVLKSQLLMDENNEWMKRSQDSDRSASSDIVDESDITVSVASTFLGVARPLTDRIDANDNKSVNSSQSMTGDTEDSLEQVKGSDENIEHYKHEIEETKEKLEVYEKEISKMTDRDVLLSKRVIELAMKKKELLEQMADIEQTVIVPLETENQELKDELSLVKEERDEAMASAVKMGEDEDVECVHRCLEDALMQKEDMDNKLEILTEEIGVLESDKVSLITKLAELENYETESVEKMEGLEHEVQRLVGLEQRTYVVEEAETRLMDRVLDLEKREQHLISELNELKSKAHEESVYVPSSDKNNLEEKLKYLEQKNEVLQDAESKYRIIECEETQHLLQSQHNELSEGNVMQPSLITPSHTESLSQVASVKLRSENQESISIGVDTTDLRSSEQYSEYSEKDSQFWSQIIVKEAKIKYLEEKLELLEHSEARLMENLIEVNQGTEESSSQQYEAETMSENKVENLMEENEFLAESVEKYKKLYKEEREKTNDLHDRVLEDNTELQELVDAQAELNSAQNMVQEIQSEYEDQLTHKETHISQMEIQLSGKNLQISQLQTRVDAAQSYYEKELEDLKQNHSEHISKNNQQIQELEKMVQTPQQHNQPSKLNDQIESELQEKIHFLELQNSQMHSYSKVSELQEQISTFQHHKEHLQTQVSELQEKVQNLQQENEQLQQSIESDKHVEDNLHGQLKLKVQELQGRNDAMTQRKEELKQQQKQHEKKTWEEIESLSQREQGLLKQVEDQEGQLKVLKAKLEKQDDETSVQSDSGVSADDHRSRFGSIEEYKVKAESQGEIFSSTAILQLSRPSSTPISQEKRATPANQGSTSLAPVAPLRAHRRGGVKPHIPSIDKASHEELMFIVQDYQEKEATLKNHIQELQTIADFDHSHRVSELEAINQNLERRVRYAETRSAGGTKSPYQHLVLAEEKGDDQEEEHVEDSTNLNHSFSSLLSASSSVMLDNPEDVLRQRIKELEGLDKYHKTQLSELENDSQVLHEIARKDKTTIHDLNVKTRELQLTKRSLKEQVTSLEVSENSLFSKCDELEAAKTRLEDRVHELEIHERRLRELTRRLKLDEQHWLSKSGGMETTVAELSANEHQLKRLLQDGELEKGGLTEMVQYLETRIRELENVEATLLQKVKTYENTEVSLQNHLVQLENGEVSSHSRASELDVMNMDLSQRLQKAVEENTILSQHITQLHGQVQELDRRLMSSKDSELSYKQHVESVQKNESSLQKKVREYELREIDSQARIRELEQTDEITNDKLAALQRSENRLKYRVQDLEGIGAQIPWGLSPGQTKMVPQKLEDCQKRVVILHSQVENLQLQLRQALNIAHSQSASETDDGNMVSVACKDFSHLQTRSAFLDETEYQMEEVEKLNKELNETILQLRQGKSASSHEVEIEVLKNRLASYKTFISKLKSSLSTGQATSLWEPEPGSDPEGEIAPSARYLPGLASERVLQSVRGLPQGKVTTLDKGNSADTGLSHIHHNNMQSTNAVHLSTPPAHGGDSSILQMDPTSTREEESHWKAIEARKPKQQAVVGSRGGATIAQMFGAIEVKPTSGVGKVRNSIHDIEEVTIGIDLPSESDLSTYHHTIIQNDTDSSCSPVPPLRRGRVKSSKTYNINISSSENESDNGPNMGSKEPTSNTAAAANNRHFDKQKSLPSSAPHKTDSLQMKLSNNPATQQAPLSSFAENSFYLPSFTQEGADSLDDDHVPPPLPASGPPGMETRTPSPKWSSDGSMDHRPSELERKDSLENSTSGMSIRNRIAMIEKQLQPDAAGGKSTDDQVYYWMRMSSETLKQAETIDRDNKHLKEEINRLEKELKEKICYINIMELWTSCLEDLLKNKNKQTDREMIEQLQLELSKLRNELCQVGYHEEDVMFDPAALKTHLEQKDKEIMTKRTELELMSQELSRCRDECRNVEEMRRTALDSLRHFEEEVLELHDKDKQLQDSKDQLQAMTTQYDELKRFKNQAVNALQPLQATVDELSNRCQEKDSLLLRLGAELRRSSYQPSCVLDDLLKLEQMLAAEARTGTHDSGVTGDTALASRLPSHLRSSSMDDLDSLFSENDSLSSGPTTATFPKRKRPTPYVNSRPRSIETLGSVGPRGLLGAHTHPRDSPSGTWGSSGYPQQGQFVAIADYDPGLFSQSGHSNIELSLREGDEVLITGPMDHTGYYEAIVNGQSGLVPANYLLDAQLNGHRQHKSQPDPAVIIGGSGTQSYGLEIHPAFRSEQASHIEHPPLSNQHPMPDAPHHLHIKGIVNERSLLLSWEPPVIDNLGNNNGFKLLGYMVYLDSTEYEKIPREGPCEVIIEGLTPDKRHLLAVQCLCGGGFMSPRAELMLEGMVKLMQQTCSSASHGRDDLDTDLSSMLNSLQYKRGQKKKVMALYDYDSEQQSPHDYTALELDFHAGDVIHVYGEPRQDGFYHGEIDDVRGLVPACFVEDLSKINKGIQRPVEQ